MALAQGWSHVIAAKFETAYGTAPAAGGWKQLPFVSHDLGKTQGLIDSDIQGTGREMDAPTRGNVVVDGSITVPATLDALGWWLRLMLGNASSGAGSGSGNFVHDFDTTKTALPSASMELAYSEAGHFPLLKGLRGNTFAITYEPEGNVSAALELIGQSQEDAQTTSVGSGASAPTLLAGDRVGSFQGSISVGGTTLATVSSATFTINNNLESLRTVKSDGTIYRANPAKVSFSGEITAFFEDRTMFQAALDDSNLVIALSHTIDANKSISFTANKCRLPVVKFPVEGPGGISATFEFMAHSDKGNNEKMLAVQLKNRTASYT